MRVDEVMSNAKCCRQGDSVQDVARIMKEESIGFVPICDRSDKPIGTVTDRDLAIRVLAEGHGGDDAIDSFMTRDVVSCRKGADLSEAERLMRDQRKSRVVVCDDQGRACGVISLAEIADVQGGEAAGKTLQEVKSDQPAAH